MTAPVEAKSPIQQRVEQFHVWCENLPPEQWLLYRGVMNEALHRQIPFAIGGGMAAMAYAGQLRDTRDIDFYIQRQNRQAMIEVILDAGLLDYYDRAPYDRNWIFRGIQDDLIVDVIWAMANQRAQVDPEWLNGPLVSVDGLTFRLLRPEETLWTKLYVLQRDRCDWPDAINMLYSIGAELDWAYLFSRTAEDTPLMAALVRAFRWICPDRYEELPSAILERLSIADAAPEKGDCRQRARLLDSRPWFTPTLDKERRP
ncbi:MAG TPA: hypothetical protein VLJ11_19420 [Bryobacteraceae bacterium]|nr:hypothetical protein [Bryobacteraceae bacterium]